jgi:hypothetical protein
MDIEDMAQEDALFPWLASDCMADPGPEDWPGGGWGDDEDEDEDNEDDA